MMKSMCRIVWSWFLLALLTAEGSGSTTTPPWPQKLLVLLLDGFRWDYAHNLSLPNFQRLQNMGVKAGYLTSDFPTLSYPNYYSLMTGLHTENHGMSANYMFSADQRDYFMEGMNPETEHAHWWEGAEPLWITATKRGIKTDMYGWPGCDVTIHNTTARLCHDSHNVTTAEGLRQALNHAVGSLTGNNGIQAEIAAVYHEQPDYVGHSYGPDSPELAETVRSIDTELGLLLDNLVLLQGQNQVNLIVVSDHGMTSVDPSRVINITTVLTDRDFYLTIMEAGSMAVIHTAEGYRDQVYDLLNDLHPYMTVYKKEDIPDRFHFKGGKYVGDILCLADLGWVIAQPLYPGFLQKNGQNMRGYHGYDNMEADMRGIFYAYGPYFKSNATVPSVAIVDIYNVMSDIVGMLPLRNNGTWSRVSPLLLAEDREVRDIV